ncbi:hypothetical protein VNO80_25950 [Phaseolus coccineus]|uniref:Uncharacterized protein n=1 Tax=Phaseolus coccineus TaxID=3886 RepID=A0AAN9LVQ5_PHACN
MREDSCKNSNSGNGDKFARTRVAVIHSTFKDGEEVLSMKRGIARSVSVKWWRSGASVPVEKQMVSLFFGENDVVFE